MEKDPIVDNGHNPRNAERVQAVVQSLNGGLPEVEPVDEEYHPFQTVEPDTQTGFSSDGNYHVVVDPDKWKEWLKVRDS